MEKIQIYPTKEEKGKIIEAGKIIGLKPAQFVKSSALKEAREILKNEEKNGAHR